MGPSWKGTAIVAIVPALTLVAAGPALGQANTSAGRKRIGSIQILELARDYFNQGDYENARKSYLEAHSAFPRNFEVLKNLGYCYYTMGPAGRARAVHFYLLAHKIQPGSRVVTEQLAKCLSDLNRHREAATLLRELADLPGADAASWRNLAQEYDAGHRHYEAVAAYEAYLRIKPDDAEARTRLGTLNRQQTAYTKALEEFQVVLSRKPDFPPAIIGMARIYSWQGRFTESLRLYDRALGLDPRSGDAASGKAFVLLWMGKTKEAESLFVTLLRRFPRDGEIAKGLESARAALDTKTKAPATKQIAAEPHDEAYFRERLSQNPLDATALKAITSLASSPRRCEESIEYGRQAMKISPDDQSLELVLANSLAYCRQYSEAIEHYPGVEC